MNVDWKEKCPKGVEREIATQHARCASCIEYIPSGSWQLGKCSYFVTKEYNEKVQPSEVNKP